ncbi:MAG: EamA family transporter [Lachnospiraceae bacterium]|nr:EamA family transporter [Lachnospiraceae bacterium]
MAAERLKYITAVVLYGTIGMFLRFTGLPAEVVVLCRGSIGSAVILLALLARGRRPDKKAIRANLKLLLASGVLLGLNWIFLFAAYLVTTVAIASLCNYLAPVLVILAAPLFLREKLDVRKLPLLALALLGIVFVSGLGEGGANVPGILLGLAAALCFVGLVLLNRRMQGIEALDKAVIQLAVSALTVLPYVLIRNLGTPLTITPGGALIVLMLGVVHTGFAYCLYFSGLSRLPVQTVAILGYLEPVVSVFCSAFFLREPLSPLGWLGAGLVIAAALISEILPSPKEKEKEKSLP